MWKVNEWTLLSSCPSLPSLPVCPQERFWRDYSERIENFHLCAFFKTIIYLFIYFWLCWVPVSVPGFSLVAVSGGHSSSRCAGLSLSWPLLLRSTGSRRAGSVVVAHGPSCSAACGIFPDQGSNPCPLHWQADSQPLCHQGSPPWVLCLILGMQFCSCLFSLRLQICMCMQMFWELVFEKLIGGMDLKRPWRISDPLSKNKFNHLHDVVPTLLMKKK